MVGKKLAAERKALAGAARKGRKAGTLRYRTHEHYNAFTYNQSGFLIKDGKIHLSKIGSIKVVLHRQPVNVKQIIVARQNGKWYAVAVCSVLRRKFCITNNAKPVGIDMGVTKFIHDSDNNVVENPLFLTKMRKPLRRSSRKLSRRLLGSRNYEKARHMRARLYQRMYNKRRDFLHKTSSYYTRKYDLIFVERLRVQNMIKNRHLARSILDSGWRTFKTMLEYKANRLVEIDPRNTSIECSRCNNPVPKTLAMRTHSCDKCGFVIDRDYNSGLNILQNGLSLISISSNLPVERREVTPVEIVNDRRIRKPTFLNVSSSQRLWSDSV